MPIANLKVRWGNLQLENPIISKDIYDCPKRAIVLENAVMLNKLKVLV